MATTCQPQLQPRTGAVGDPFEWLLSRPSACTLSPGPGLDREGDEDEQADDEARETAKAEE